MGIKYVQIIDSYIDAHDSTRILNDYIHYCLLVVYNDRQPEIIEVNNNRIGSYLPYVRTSIDELSEIKETVKGISEYINKTVDQKLSYFIDTLFEIPDIQDKNEVEALSLLKNAGLTPVLDITYPEGTPQNGIVREFHRNKENFKKVNVRIVHPLPDVENMNIDEALSILKEAGFTADVTRKAVSGMESGTVLHCSRAYEHVLHVYLEVSSSIPETRGMTRSEACDLLSSQGYKISIKEQIHTGTPGIVLDWSSLTDTLIMLYVSIPEKYQAKNVEIEWNDMQDSNGDTYAAFVEYSNRSHDISINLSYSVRTKSKHQIIGIMNESSEMWHIRPSYDYTKTMEPNAAGELQFTIPYGMPFAEIPSDISLLLETQYGLIKKRDDVLLHLHINW